MRSAVAAVKRILRLPQRLESFRAMLHVRVDTLHAVFVEVNDHLPGANAIPEELEDPVGVFLHLTDGGTHRLLCSRFFCSSIRSRLADSSPWLTLSR